MNKLIFFLEKMWLVIAIICVIMAVYKTITIGYRDGMFFLLFALLAAVLFLLRRRMRIRMQQQNQKDD